MQLEWMVSAKNKPTLRTFLSERGFSRRLLIRMFHHEKGAVLINGKNSHLKERLLENDFVQATLPIENKHPYIEPYDKKIDILYEDDHLFIVNKPPYTVSSPSWDNPSESLASHILAYYEKQNYENQRIHFVTRLDRETSGVTILTKHQLAHAILDAQTQKREIKKTYLGITPPSESILTDHGYLDFPIGRREGSVIEREVCPDGKDALTEYRRLHRTSKGDIFQLQLHTGRTHQIRVHFAHVNLPLLGDSLYGGSLNKGFSHQALHCREVQFIHPITRKRLTITAELPEDMKNWLSKVKTEEISEFN